jgi:hypothetical protein
VVWLVYPILTAVHVEGFSASIESLAIHLASGSLADYDRLHPANLEFFALSRLGTVTFIAALIRWLGFSSEWAMRTMMWCGFAALIWSSTVLVRRWTGASVTLIVAMLVLIPGITESAFFYNDNVLSAALTISALAILGPSARVTTSVLAGLLFGAGIVARLDAVLLAPAVALIGLQQHGRIGSSFVLHGLAFTTAALVPVVLVPGSVDASIFDVVRISNYAVTLWNRTPSLAPHAREFAYFIGTPAALLAAFGILKLVNDRAIARLSLLVGVPLFFNLVALGKIWQSRQLLPMTPFFVALVICGLQYLMSDSPDGSRQRLRVAVFLISAGIFFGPVGRLQISDGPRAPYGRFWSPIRWTRWQSAVRENMTDISRLVTSFERTGQTSVLTDTWDGDRYLHLHLQRAGFVVRDIGRTLPMCASAGELFVRGSAHVVHLRLHQPFLPSWPTLAGERLTKLAVPCLMHLHATRIYFLSPGARAIALLRASPSLHSQVDTLSLASSYFASGYDRQVAISLAPSDIDRLTASFAIDAAARKEASGDVNGDLARAKRLMENQVWRARKP